MDGENNGKSYSKLMIWGKTPYFWKHPYFFVEQISFIQPSKDRLKNACCPLGFWE